LSVTVLRKRQSQWQLQEDTIVVSLTGDISTAAAAAPVAAKILADI
jgi:hypothetical protein